MNMIYDYDVKVTFHITTIIYSRPNKASIAAQRRLFPPSVDKVDPTEV